MRLEPTLSAVSADEAHLALDDFGIARLDSSEHEVVWTPTADPGDVTSEPHPSDTEEEQGVEDTREDKDDSQEPDSRDPGARQQPGSGGFGGESKPGSRGEGQRSSNGGSASRTGRQTRLRSYVVETDEDEGDLGTVGDEAPDLSPIDVAGVKCVLEYERSCGRKPKEMAHSNEGFDVETYDKRGALIRRIEIKSTGGGWSIAGVMVPN